MLVTKTSMGTYLIEDIRVWVSHGSATFIEADNVVNSKDLYRAINSGILIKLTNAMGPAVQPIPESPLHNENKELKEALAKSVQQGESLANNFALLQSQMQTLLDAVGRIESAPKVIQTVFAPGGAQAVVTPSLAVSEELPVFVPDDLLPTDAEVRINFSEKSSEEDTTSGAVSALRKLRDRKPG